MLANGGNLLRDLANLGAARCYWLPFPLEEGWAEGDEGIPFDSNKLIPAPSPLGEGWGEGAGGLPFDLNTKLRLPLPMGEGWGEGTKYKSNL